MPLAQNCPIFNFWVVFRSEHCDEKKCCNKRAYPKNNGAIRGKHGDSGGIWADQWG